MSDAEVLRRAVVILRTRSTRPNGMWMRVLVRVLTDTADRLDSEAVR